MRLPVVPICLLFVIASLAQLIAQRPPAFDVVSVKRYQPDARGRVDDAISIFPGGRLSAPGATLQGLITTAYGLLDIQVVDSGRMLGFARYQIEGRTNPDVTLAEARAMLRTLLTERFALITHRETREMPVYVMTLDRKPGAQLRPSGRECAMPKGPTGVPAPPPPPGGPTVGRVLSLNGYASRCAALFFNSTSGAHWSLRETTMTQFAERLVGSFDRPVLDRTGLDGSFDIDLTYSADNPVVDTSNAPNAPSLITALREQLGLRLESTKAPVEVLVIDRVQTPTEN
ncbi:MAG TPA: TIGR03435 family protein [Vicinamibacterales bacterium]|nr:TIGR03435 family protein [Vicinamibacterales bacterium]